ncbi:hypothetical protein BWX42_02910 [Dolosigranulum pigrum]|uniref:Uncharacterized protein n=1 Tax=Dolosigranulum pigrum TaxID=29394 RepID=A0A1S8KM85_9LACT|nr:hypothetical protein BWX42_02910 [Dolosigranulum pigrum]
MSNFVRTLLKICIFISSYIPIILLIFIQNMRELSLVEIKNTFTQYKIIWLILVALMIISFTGLCLWLKYIKRTFSDSNRRLHAITDIKGYNGEILNFFVTYIVPLLALDLNSSTSIVVNLLLVIMNSIYFIRNDYLYYNMLLILLGYNIFESSEGYIIISKKDKFEIINKSLKAVQIGTSNLFYID